MRRWRVLCLGRLPRSWRLLRKFEPELKIKMKIAELANV
jgi:hypothetical protein